MHNSDRNVLQVGERKMMLMMFKERIGLYIPLLLQLDVCEISIENPTRKFADPFF
jgi:hypothetical protein